MELSLLQVQRDKLKACKADLLFDTILVGGGNLEFRIATQMYDELVVLCDQILIT